MISEQMYFVIERISDLLHSKREFTSGTKLGIENLEKELSKLTCSSKNLGRKESRTVECRSLPENHSYGKHCR